ncbi:MULTISPECIES: hypothetical protein [unclassified Shinella]|uniref:hypothetical protein n=1 Tax=unclassified Shinella TaxID=2643062 RepID=UPI00234FB21B|nr:MULTISPECIES: hypothetical protein [unclassified Shinella]MCO5152587.1 hypothetical protein [Shinella sp.]MDC7261882.1 hypothetical protein [Shinella sp. HY16]MDC7268777.1 hypothetical protein [Shinella sp. YZ44]
MKKFRIAVFAALFWSQANAGEFTPSDYSPVEEAVIKTLRIDRDDEYRVVVVGIANRGARPFNASYSCTLLDPSGSPFDETGGSASTVPPGQEVIEKSISFTTDASGAVCRIEYINYD